LEEALEVEDLEEDEKVKDCEENQEEDEEEYLEATACSERKKQAREEQKCKRKACEERIGRRKEDAAKYHMRTQTAFKQQIQGVPEAGGTRLEWHCSFPQCNVVCDSPMHLTLHQYHCRFKPQAKANILWVPNLLSTASPSVQRAPQRITLSEVLPSLGLVPPPPGLIPDEAVKIEPELKLERLPVGAPVVLTNLKARPALNGKRGIIMQWLPTGRCEVNSDGELYSLKAANVVLAEGAVAVLQGLSRRQDLNGTTVEIRAWDDERYLTRAKGATDEQPDMKIKPANLRIQN